MSKMKSIEELIKASQFRRLDTAIKSGILSEADVKQMNKGVKPGEHVLDFNESSAVVSHESKTYNVELSGHDWDAVSEEYNRINKNLTPKETKQQTKGNKAKSD